VVSSNKAYLVRDWGGRNSTVFSYLFLAQKVTSGGSERNRYQQVSAEYRRELGRAGALNASYEYNAGEQTDSSNRTRPNKRQTLTGGPEFRRALSRTRYLSIMLDTGFTHVDTIDARSGARLEGWLPAAGAATSVDLSRTWWAGADYRRSFSMLQGLTGEFYSTDRVGVSTGGRLAPRMDLSVSATTSNGRVAVGGGASDTFRLFGTAVGGHVELTAMMALLVRYDHYRQDYSNPAALPIGFPAHYHRQAFSIGLTVWRSLTGSLQAEPRAPGEW
jgi:hypothetical protein